MIIEFIGFPGSGKSFLAKKLYNQFKKSKKKIIFENKLKLNLYLKLYFLIKFTIKNLLYIFTIFVISFKNKKFIDPIWLIKHRKWMINEIILYEYCKKGNRILIRSEGLHHRLLFFLIGIDKKNFNFFEKMLIRSTPIPDKLIMIEISKKQSIKNTIKRNNGFKYDDYTKFNLKKQYFILHMIKKFFKKFYKSNFIYIKKIKFHSETIKSLNKYI